jgi:phage shock protein E
MFRIVKTYIFLITIFCPAYSFAQQVTFQDVSSENFKARMDLAAADAVLVDLRTPDEVKKGIIPNSVNIDYFRKDFEKQIAALDKSKTYFLYCAVGGRSTETAELMVKLGFQKVYNLKEGFSGWQKKKFPVSPPQ